MHRRFTEALITELEEADAEKIPLPAADKSVIVKFLKDNDITAEADDVGMANLRDTFDELEQARQARAASILRQQGADDDELTGVI